MDCHCVRFRHIRDALAATPSYIASAQVRDQLTWLKDGRRHRLVWKKDVARADDLYKSSIANGDTPAATTVSNAELSMIVAITDDDCWLMADAGWRGPSDYTPSLSDIKLTCTGVAPAYTYLEQDFNAALNNIEHFMKMSDGTKRVGLLVTANNVKKIRFRHVPFTVSLIFVTCVSMPL